MKAAINKEIVDLMTISIFVGATIALLVTALILRSTGYSLAAIPPALFAAGYLIAYKQKIIKQDQNNN